MVGNDSCHTRTGKSKKTLKGKLSEWPIKIQRNRHGAFEPQLMPSLDDKILSLHSRGKTVREIQAHREEM